MKKKLKEKIKVKGLVIMGLLVACTLLFHNCVPSASNGGGSSDGSGTATGGTTAGGATLPVCPYTSNPAPVVEGIFADAALTQSANSINYRVGMGNDAGNEGTRTLYVRAHAGDNLSQIISVNCNGTNDVALNCDINNGNLRIRINPGPTAECLTGSTTVRVSVTDSVNAPGCQNLSANSNQFNLNINFINGCYPTTRLNPSVQYDAGQMGASVAIDGNWAVAATPGDDLGGNNAGAAYVMFFNGSQWTVVERLVPNDIAAGAALAAVAISGNTIVLGASLYNNDTGRAWVYQYNGTTWNQVATLNAPIPTLGERFGHSVAISNGQIAVGAPRNSVRGTQAGAVYVFSGSNYSSVQTLYPDLDANINADVLARGEFGTSLAFGGNTLVVGAPFPNSAVTRSEAVYVFRANNGVFSAAQKISNGDAGTDKRFGFAVGLSGNQLIVGAPFLSANNVQEVGRAYIYTRASATANFDTANILALNPLDPGTKDHFGHSVFLTSTNAFVGAPDKTFDQTAKVGAVYMFNTAGTQVFKIRSYRSDRDNDSFGVSIGVANGWLISGAFNDESDINFLNAGSVYMVDIP